MRKTILLTAILMLVFSLLLASSHIKASSADIEVTVQEVSPFAYVCLAHKGPFTEIEKAIGQLIPTMENQRIFPTGPMLGVFYNSPEEVSPEELEWEIGFPVTPQAEPLTPLQKKVWDYPLVASATHVGAYEKTGETYLKIFEWIEANDYMQVGPLMEQYLTMPTPDTNPEDMRSGIWVPIVKK